MGTRRTVQGADGWEVRTRDGRPSVHTPSSRAAPASRTPSSRHSWKPRIHTRRTNRKSSALRPAPLPPAPEAAGFSVVREYVGHGIGRDMHEDPNVPNFGRRRTGLKLLPGMGLAIFRRTRPLRSGFHFASTDAGTVPTCGHHFLRFCCRVRRKSPGSICASVNDQIVHGIPSKRVKLREGDIISIDTGGATGTGASRFAGRRAAGFGSSRLSLLAPQPPGDLAHGTGNERGLGPVPVHRRPVGHGQHPHGRVGCHRRAGHPRRGRHSRVQGLRRVQFQCPAGP